MTRVPVGQQFQQQTAEEGPSALEAVWSLLKMFALMYMHQMGLVPRSAAAKRDLTAFRKRLAERGEVAELEKKEVDRIVNSVAKWFGFPDVGVAPDDTRKLIYDIVYYINLFFPEALDYLLAPTGSLTQLYDYVGAAFQKFDPSLSWKGPSGRLLFRDVADYIAKNIYANADLKSHEFIAKTGGMPAGAYGEMVYHMMTMGLIKYNAGFDEIIRDINRHGPAVVKTALLLEDLGQSVDISDAVVAYQSLIPSLAPEKVGGATAEQVERLRFTVNRLRAIFAPAGAGQLAADEALKKDAERIVHAINSMGGRWYGALVFAYSEGKLRPGSPGYAAAQQILSGRPIPIFNANQAYTLLVQSGLSAQDALILLQSPNLYKPYFNDQRVQHALRGAQLMEFERNVSMLAAGLIRGGVSPGLARMAAAANFAGLIGYTYPEAEQIIRRYDPNLFVEVDKLVRENMERPQSPVLGRNKTGIRLISAIKDVAENPPTNWWDTLMRVLGATMDYYPAETVEPRPGQGQDNQKITKISPERKTQVAKTKDQKERGKIDLPEALLAIATTLSGPEERMGIKPLMEVVTKPQFV